jgi:hypothetical protein
VEKEFTQKVSYRMTRLKGDNFLFELVNLEGKVMAEWTAQNIGPKGTMTIGPFEVVMKFTC